MKKLYILTAIFALLTLSLNAQLLKVDQNGKVVQPKAQAGKVVQPKAQNGKEVTPPDRYFRMGPSRASTDPVTPPHSNGFNSQDEFDWWETIDNNNDNRTWHLSNSQARVQWNGSSAMDDWLVSAPVHLVAGRVYKFYIDARSGGNYTERIEVKLASANTATALSSGTTVIAARNVTEQSYITLSNENVTVSQTGDYYFGIHGISIADQYYLYVDNFVIDVQVTDPTIQVAGNTVNMSSRPNGSANQTVAVTGLNLTTDITATVSGQDASLFSVSPASLGTGGGDLTITYSPTAVGTHTATITLSSTGADDVTITVNGACKNELTICDGTTTNGYLPVYGYYFEANQINQMVYPASRLTDLVGTTIKSMKFYPSTSGSYTGINFYNGSIEFSLGCLPENTPGYDTNRNRKTGYSLVATKNMPDAGQPSLTEWEIVFDTPFEYTGGDLLIDVNTVGGHWGTTNFYGVEQTGAGSYSRGTSLNDYGFYSTENLVQNFLPKVTFEYEENTNPKIEVSPQTLTISDSGTNNTFTVQGANLGDDNVGVTVPQGSAFSTTTSDQWWGFVNNNGSVSGTVTVNYGGRDLSATETVTVANNLTSATVNVTYVPDLYIYCDYGASPWDFSANPAVAMTNNGDGTYTATLNNIPDNSHILFGRTTGLTYYWEDDNNRLFFGASTDGGDWGYGDNTSGYLDTDAGNDYPVKYHPIYFSEGGTYTITINANDYTFTIDKYVLPAPENVVATPNSQNQTATVTWDVPSNLPTVTETVYESVTEGFDDTSVFEPFSLGHITADNHIGAIGGWTLYDPTGATVWGVDGGQFTNMSEPHAWFVMNPSQATGINITPYSPEQYMESICPVTDANTPSDHWLISPELSGNAQTITFYERVITTQYEPGYETYEILVSSNDIDNTNPSSGFTVLQTINSSATDWTLRSIELPAGTKHFAIHHISDDVFGMMVDDVTYQIATTAEVPVTPVSYNIYLDGVLVGNVNANDPLTYTFNNVSAGDHTAAVSAVYEGGIESAATPSNTFTIVPKTDAPAISVVPGETAYTITATAADPNAAVVMTVDGVEYTGTGSVSVTIDRGTSDKNVAVSATAQEDGKIVSDPAEQTVNVPMLPITPTPTITYEQTNATVVVTATGQGTVYLEVDGQTASGEGTVSITIMRSIDDKTVTANATAVDTNHQPSATASEDITIPALAGNPATAKEGLLRMHLLVVDQFKEEIPDDNSHPDRYGYVLKWEEPANVADHKESGTVKVEIKKTEAQVNGYYTLSQVEADTNHDNSEITLDVLTADVGMYLPGEDPDVLYYEMQSKKDANPALGEDYITQLQYIKNAQKYEEMLATSPNKTHQYPAEETYHYFDDSTPIVTGTYGVNFMTYAPSVSTWGIQRRYFEVDGLDNTYGAPIWKTGVGQVRVISTEAQLQRGPQGSTQWDGVGGPCSLVFLGVEAFGDLPSADVSNIQYEPYMFRVWVQSPGNYLRGCNLIGEHVDPNKPGEHWDGDGTCYGAVPVLVYEQLTTDGHLYKHVQSMEEGNNVAWGEKIQFGALDSGISDLIVYVRFYYRSTGHGISGTRFTLRGNRDGEDEGDETPEVPGYYASEGDANPDITTGINGIYTDLNKPVESVTYVNAQGMTNDQPFDGVNIVITRYTDGTMTTTKLVR